MQDRGEKIVSLAQEILCGERERDEQRGPGKACDASRESSLKAAMIAAFLAAAGTGVSAHLIQEAQRPATRYERVEIDALFFYTAREFRVSETELRQEAQDALALASFQDLSANDYRRVRHYLWLRYEDGLSAHAIPARKKTIKQTAK